MISFDTPTHRFHLRAAAVIVRDGSILLHKAEHDAFWALPGGRVEPGEHAAAAVARELHEELEVSVTVGSLVFVVENFFAYWGKQNHEVGLYFTAQAALDCPVLTSDGPYEGREGNQKLTFDWFTREQLSGIEVRPSFLARALAEPELHFTHIVHRDENAL